MKCSINVTYHTSFTFPRVWHGSWDEWWAKWLFSRVRQPKIVLRWVKWLCFVQVMEETTQKHGGFLKHNLSVAVIAENLKRVPHGRGSPVFSLKGKLGREGQDWDPLCSHISPTSFTGIIRGAEGRPFRERLLLTCWVDKRAVLSPGLMIHGLQIGLGKRFSVQFGLRQKGKQLALTHWEKQKEQWPSAFQLKGPFFFLAKI